MDQMDREFAELEAQEAGGGGSGGTQTMVFEKRDAANDFVRMLAEVEIEASVDARQESHDKGNMFDRALAGSYYVIVPGPGQGFQAEIYYDLHHEHGVVPSAVPQARPEVKKQMLERLLVRRATLAGRWNSPAPCSSDDTRWYGEIAGLGQSEVMACVRRARETFLNRQESEQKWSLLGAIGLCVLGALAWLALGFGFVSGLLLASGAAFGIFALTRESR